jgi:hypothetical protein
VQREQSRLPKQAKPMRHQAGRFEKPVKHSTDALSVTQPDIGGAVLIFYKFLMEESIWR